MSRSEYLRAGRWQDDLRRLSASGLSDRAAARELSRLWPGLRFTRQRVLRWRLRGVDRLGPLPLPAVARRVHQMLCGWTHLLPGEWRYPCIGRTDGVVLRPREADVLSLLRDHGPQTPAQLAGRLGVRRLLDARRRSRLARLLALGLVVRLAPRLYALSERALPPPGPRPLTSRERSADG
jgi:hypothetical protein